ncbi:MAG: glycosyl transferase [Cyanobacteriota bacterium]|nr:glycosyl transferase [Cyanobacteriota bacterium]
MKKIPIYVAITAHGFGHVSRTAAVLDTLLRLHPDILPIFVTPAPHWLLADYVKGDFLHRPRRLDIGVIQADGLRMDLPATLEQLAALKQQAAQRIAEEVSFIQTNRVRLVVADIPPLASAIAQAAGIPCWMVGNFGWDFIYQEYGDPFRPYVEWIQHLYGQSDRLFRLPLHAPMPGFPHQQAVGLTGAEPLYPPDQVQAELSLESHRPTVLLTFGGLGLQHFPYQQLAAYPDWQFLTFDTQAPALPNLIPLSSQTWRPVDVMPVCRQIITKPGYGTLSEALRLGIPVTCLERFGFAEAPYLLAGLQQFGRHQILHPSTFLEQPWTFLEQPFRDPSAPDQLPLGGNRAIAEAILNYVES